MAVTGRRVTATPDTVKSPSENNPTGTVNSPGSNSSKISRVTDENESSPGTKYHNTINPRRRVEKYQAGASKSAFYVHEADKKPKEIEIKDGSDRGSNVKVTQHYENETLKNIES